MNGTETASLIIPAVLAIAGYFLSYFYRLKLERRKNRLKRVERQLNEFYGPLLATVQANQKAWDGLVQKNDGKSGFYKKINNPTPQQSEEFLNWMNLVFMPNNEKLYQIIVEKTSLLKDDQLPTPLLELMAHILEYRIELKRVAESETKTMEMKTKYPAEDLLEYCKRNFEQLKAQQAKLL